METIELVLKLAAQRGLWRGQDHERHDCYDECPLSGEWAGESVPELLGDLIATGERIYLAAGGDDDLIMETVIGPICDSYLEGYQAAFADRLFCDSCSVLLTDDVSLCDICFTGLPMNEWVTVGNGDR